MITEILAKKVHAGIAKWKNKPVGMSGNAFLPVPNDSYIVIIGITVYDFINGGDAQIPQLLRNVLKHLCYQVNIKSGKQMNNFVIRPTIIPYIDNVNNIGTIISNPTRDNGTSGQPAGHSHFDMLMYCDYDILFNINMQTKSENILDSDFSAPADGATDENTPEGYRNQQTNQVIQINPGQGAYVPLTQKGYRSAPIAAFRRFYNFIKFPVNDNTRIRTNNDPLYLFNEYVSNAFPIINVQYLEVNEPPNKRANK